MTAETLVLEREHLPEVPLKPAPWQLHGSGYVLIAKVPESLSDDDLFVPPSLRDKRHGRTVYILLLDYQQSDCGPYHELMIAPASFDFSEGRFPSITRIYVSTYDSVVNGRRNWGIPKDRADFAVEHVGKAHRVTLSRDGHEFARLHLQSGGLALPVNSALLPAGMRTVKQHWQGQVHAITLKAKGSLRMAKLLDWSFDPTFFPDLAGASVVAAAYLPGFEMTFPLSDVRPE